MCGITARVAADDTLDPLLESLENLEYRGYDSAGVALKNGSGIAVQKRAGTVADLRGAIATDDLTGGIGIGHTRWSTHGEPSDGNAHPHTDCTGEIAIVHNGIIENYAELREALEARDHEFTSETDSEVVPHLVEERLAAGSGTETAFRDAVAQLEGSYAIAMVVRDEERIYATRRGSPLVLGVGSDAHYLASDVPAFLEFTDDVVYLEDGDVAVVGTDEYHVTDAAGTPVHRPVESVEWDPQAAEKGGYDHFMLKEIQEQPTALRQAIEGRIDGDDVVLEDFPPGTFADVERIHLVACGTSYHAGMYGERLLADWGVTARTVLASEYAHYPPPIDDGTLVIGVTQSGETADTLAALAVARAAGARTLALTNVIGSTAARQCDDSLFIRAGPEIGVAATKTFSSQVATLVLLGERLARDISGEPSPGHEERLGSLRTLPDAVESVIATDDAERVGRDQTDTEAHFFIGRGCAYPVALEGALKFKEITYEHAEAFAAGELKHGPLALVTAKTPVFAVSAGRDQETLVSTIREIQTRGAPVVAVGPRTESTIVETADDFLPVPGTHPDLVPLLANIQLQLVAYHAAASLGRSIDKPRNLAKSVTVE
jgi:glucosamine--fructose-6-phosphate aminotransferase (isomerizing)